MTPRTSLAEETLDGVASYLQSCRVGRRCVVVNKRRGRLTLRPSRLDDAELCRLRTARRRYGVGALFTPRDLASRARTDTIRQIALVLERTLVLRGVGGDVDLACATSVDASGRTVLHHFVVA